MLYPVVMMRVLLTWHQCPKEVPESFCKAMEDTFATIIESERIKREWQPILHPSVCVKNE